MLIGPFKGAAGEGSQVMVKGFPAGMVAPGVWGSGLVMESKPVVCAKTVEAAARAKRHDFAKEYCILKVGEKSGGIRTMVEGIYRGK